MKYYKLKNWTLFLIISCSFSLFSGLFLKNVYDLQFTNSEYFQEQALSYRIKSETLKAKRGSIYDKNLLPIATSTQAFNIGIFPNKISNIKEASLLLSPLIMVTMPFDTLQQRAIQPPHSPRISPRHSVMNLTDMLRRYD